MTTKELRRLRDQRAWARRDVETLTELMRKEARQAKEDGVTHKDIADAYLMTRQGLYKLLK